MQVHVSLFLSFSLTRSRRSDLSQIRNQSTNQFVTALVFNSAAFAIQVVAFALLRPHFQAIYEPQSVIPPEQFVFLPDPFPHVLIT
jgi:hypothetical protein